MQQEHNLQTARVGAFHDEFNEKKAKKHLGLISRIPRDAADCPNLLDMLFLQIIRLLTRAFADDSARLAGINVGAPAHHVPSADFGLIGLAVMGQNLILNAADHGFTVCAYNRTTSKVDRFLENEAKGKSIVGAWSVEEFVSKLKRPRRIMLLVMAGKPVDQFIESLLPHLEKGDIIIDGGNSHFPDSNRRTVYLAEKGINFVGSGVSGGEEGARYGPSLMPGGNEAAWPHIKDIFQSIAAKSDGEPCCDWVGDEGAGHYVKMVHNGIEYGDMQLICEAYDILKRGLGLSGKEIGDIFAKWNKGVLDSFLIEITRDVLYYNDNDGTPLVEKILDKAGQKGTGKWTAINALDLGMPVTLIGESVFSRCLSALKDERTRASTILDGPSPKFEGDKDAFVADLEQALYASKIISYAQGFMLIQNAAKEYNWKLNKPSIALMWRGGCIIRSVFLKDITNAYRNNPDLENLLFDDFFTKAIHKAQSGWRNVVSKAALWDLPANLLQAQRDYFGAHTFRIKPEHASETYPEGKDIHVNWTGRGGDVSASTYVA
ncbi:6-phosphogluconate dehydrogenase decarboxylating 1 [Penicillium chermesinum]|uniref:6-phosphogluconate dehydrogenase, decarboxylating n=1 Tax=Penicillium chermesinum TaxID=63820 RepID=A0A9W9NTF5_9EURO|nr:6-phosphogluconate dehydrogenase decarboxylating 1 [Penicillium chermesinum]KAJ5225809.1 6-phosphogluconate dehydrogenase decarboxylating 1 [Penicillium chermesinum]